MSQPLRAPSLFRVTAPVVIFATGDSRDLAEMHALAAAPHELRLGGVPLLIQEIVRPEELREDEKETIPLSYDIRPIRALSWAEAMRGAHQEPSAEALASARISDFYLEALRRASEPLAPGDEDAPEGVPGVRLYRVRAVLEMLIYAQSPAHAGRIAAENAAEAMLRAERRIERITRAEQLRPLEEYAETHGQITMMPGRFVEMEAHALSR